MDAPASKTPGRNEPCHCGSGRKYKQCCLDADEKSAREARAKAQAESAAAAPAARWGYLDALPSCLADAADPVRAFRAALVDGDRELAHRFQAEEPVERLVRDRAGANDYSPLFYGVVLVSWACPRATRSTEQQRP